jgi:hypothetical protein
MLEQQRDDLVVGAVGGGIERQVLEPLVLSYELRGLVRDGSKDPPEVGLGRSLLQVFDDVELDATVAEDLDDATSLASARVEVDLESLHRRRLSGACEHLRQRPGKRVGEEFVILAARHVDGAERCEVRCRPLHVQ